MMSYNSMCSLVTQLASGGLAVNVEDVAKFNLSEYQDRLAAVADKLGELQDSIENLNEAAPPHSRRFIVTLDTERVDDKGKK